jgi:hypothetical protein
MTPFAILAGFICCVVTSLALGVTAVRLLRIDLGKAETLALGYVIGSAVTSTLVLGFGLSGFISKTVFVALALCSVALFWGQRAWLAKRCDKAVEPMPAAVRGILLLAFVPYTVIYFRQALSPEISPDAIGYHLGLVNLWTHAGRIYRIADMMAALPEGIEMLFLYSFAIGRHSAAALVHLSFFLDLPVLMLLYGRRFRWSYRATAFAAILVFVSPLFGTIGSVAYVDLALAAVCFGAFYLLQLWRGNGSTGTLIACGALAGFAVAIKLTAAPLLIVMAIVVIWDSRGAAPGKVAPALGALLLTAGFMCGPYFVRDWVWFDNPIAPFGNAIFPNRWFHVSMERVYESMQMPSHTGMTWREFAVGLTIGNAKLPYSFGTLFLMVPVCLAGLIWQQSRLMVVTALALAAVYAANKDPRFLIPAMVFAAMGLGYVLDRLPGGGSILFCLAAIHLVISWPAFMDYTHFPPAGQWRIRHVSWREALRIVPESKYLSRLPDYVLAQQLEAVVPDGEPVLAFTGGAMQSYTTRHLVVSWLSGYGEQLADLPLSRWHSPEDRRQRFSFAIPRAAVKRLRIVQDGRNKDLMWNVDEVELRSNGKVLPVSPAWRLDASPNSWDVGAAFDGKLATRWRSWDSLRPGMFISVDFNGSQKLDSVDVILDNREWTTLGEGAWAARMWLEITRDDGKQLRVVPKVSMEPPVDLRRQAVEALEADGIHYLLINSGDWQQREFRAQPEIWGMHAVAAGPEATLYRLD